MSAVDSTPPSFWEKCVQEPLVPIGTQKPFTKPISLVNLV